MKRAALYPLVLVGAATVSFGALAQTQGINDAPEDETAPTRDRERPDHPAAPASSDAGAEVDRAPSASALPSASAAPAASAPAASSAASPDVPAPASPAASATTDDEGPPPSQLGFSFGIRGSYATPFGAAAGAPLNQVMLGLFPIGLDLGWFFSPNLYVGAYGLYGFAVGVEPTGDTCSDPDETCSATYIGFGVTAEWHFRPQAFYDPWVGAEVGYEIINLTAGDEATQLQDQSGALSGFDVGLRAGLDFKPGRYYGMGPFVELSSGHFARPPAADGVDAGSAVALHEWLGFGLRLHSGI